jgi:hypothetical protein
MRLKGKGRYIIGSRERVAKVRRSAKNLAIKLRPLVLIVVSYGDTTTSWSLDFQRLKTGEISRIGVLICFNHLGDFCKWLA